MARPVNSNYVLQISQALNEAKASEIAGLSSAEISEITGIPRATVDRILRRPEFGFTEAAAKSGTGATTWYHDFTKMMVYSAEREEIQPLEFESEEKTRFLINNLMNALMVVDPSNKLIAAVGKEIAEKEADKGKPKRQKRDYFDWLVYPFKSDIIEWLTENQQAKVMTDDFLGDVEKFPIESIIHARLYRTIELFWNHENKNFRPEYDANEKRWRIILAIGLNALMIAAYLRENDKSNNQESEEQNP